MDRVMGASAVMWVALLLAASETAGADELGDRTLMRALAAADSGDFAAALAILSGPLAQGRRGSPWSEARFVAAQAALMEGQPEVAERFLDGLDGELVEAADFVWSLQARALRQRRDWSGAQRLWRRLLAERPDSPAVTEAAYGVADAAFAGGDWRAAVNGYSVALRLGPRSSQAAGARFNLGVANERLRRWVDAAAAYSAIVFYRPDDELGAAAAERFDALVSLGRTPPPSLSLRMERIDRLLSARRHDEVARELDAVEATTATRSAVVAVLTRRAQLAFAERRFADALPAFAALAAQSRGWRKRSYEQMVARCYSAANDTEAAISAYEDLAERYRATRDGREAAFKAAWLAYNARQHARALRLFGEFISRYPDDSAVDEALWYLAWNAYRLDDLPTALSSLERLERDHPSSALVLRARYWQGRILGELGQRQEAIAAFRRTIATAPLASYARMAAQRLEALDTETAGELGARSPLLLASAGELPALPEVPREPGPDELPDAGGVTPLSAARLPWGGAVLDWDNADGRRALLLLRLGLRQHAAAICRQLPALPGVEPRAVAYGRARLLYGLGDFNSAYRLAAAAFRDDLDAVPTEETRRFFRLVYPAAYRHLVQASATEFAVSPLLMLAIMRQESAFATRALSSANARGLMQIIPPTATRIADALGLDGDAVEQLNDPPVNVRLAGWYLAELVRKYRGHVALAVAAYNGGPRAVSRWVDANPGMPTDEFLEEIPYRETRQYVRHVLDNLVAYEALYGSSRTTLPLNIPESYLDNIDF
jgi:soluble lytic murein transglycosylase